MTSKGGDTGSSGSYRNITAQGTGIVIGDGSSVVVQYSLPPMQSELLGKIDAFMDLLARHEGSLENPSDVRESVMAARREAAESAPKWSVVRALLRGIAVSVGRVASLTDAINGILEFVGRISK
jgi:hypothetical protein